MKTNTATRNGFCGLILIGGALLVFAGSGFIAAARADNNQGLPTRTSTDAKSESTQTSLPNGIEVRRGEMLLRVVALRDDVLRVRLADNGALPEDASWAVAPDIRSSKVDVSQDSSADS